MSPRRLLPVIVCLLGAAVCLRLGLWQLDRLRERREANATALAARSLPPVDLGGAAAADSALAYRRLVADGRYDHRHEVIVRGETYQGTPGVLVVTPLRLAGADTAVLVNRGFVPAPDAVTAPQVDSLQEPGEVRVEGIGLPIPSGGGKPITRRGRTTWARLDLAALRDTLPYPILGVLLRQTPDSLLPRLPRRLPPPSLDEGPHRNYAIQWFAFTAMAVVFAGIMASRRAPGSSG